MSLYVEVMCDVRDETPLLPPALLGDMRCHSFRNRNPQGSDVATARKAAKAKKWKLKGNLAICPGCQLSTAGEQFIENNFN